MKNTFTIEICCGSFVDCLSAASCPEVDRIELNSALELGGLTPSLATLQNAKQYVRQKIICMVRTRPAGFVYSDMEKKIMLADARILLENGADGIAFGCLQENHEINQEFTAKMVSLIHSYHGEAVFHKAFDETPDMDQAAETLLQLGVDRILTSGGKSDVYSGRDVIAHLQETYGAQIQILPGGGVSENNIAEVLQATHCKQFHMTAKSAYEDNGSYFAVDAQRIKRILARIPTGPAVMLTNEDQEMLTDDPYEEKMLPEEDEERRS